MSNILKGLNEGYFNRDEQDQQNAMDTRRRSDLSGERNAGLNEPNELPTSSAETRNGVYEYNVPTGQEKIAQELGLQLHKGHWFSRVPVQRANFQFGRPQFHEIPSKNVSEAEQDYGPEYQDKVQRLGQMAKQGERKTVWDPVKRVYKTVPVNPPKEQGVAEGSEYKSRHAHKQEQDKAYADYRTKHATSSMALMTRAEFAKDQRERAAKKKQGVAEGSSTMWEVSFDYGPHQSETVKVKARSAQEAVDKVETAAEKKGRSIMVNWARPAEQSVAEGVAETLPMDDAVKVLRQYGADHFKTTSNELHFYKQGRPFSVDLVMNPDATRSVTLSSLNSATRGLKGQGVAEEQLDELKCWSGYTRVQGVPAGAPGSCKKKTNEEGVAEGQHSCPHCGGEMVSEELMNEKKDACYYKVKSRYKVWPSAYASGALVKCRKSGADSWGNGGKKNESSILEGIEQVDENLHKWFKEKWVRFGPDGKIRGDCARGDDSEGKPKCLPQSKAHGLGKKGRASAASRKRREDPNPERSGKAINVTTKKKSNEGVAEGYQFKGPFPFDVDHMHGGRGINLPSAPTKKFFTDKKQWLQTVNDINSSKYDDNSDYIGVTGRSTVEINGREWARWSDAQQKGYIELSSMSEQGVAEEQLDEKWSQKYKDSINCSNPKGFSQKAHCQGKNK